MTAPLFLGNHVTDFSRVSLRISTSTNSSDFDEDFVSNAISFTSAANVFVQTPLWAPQSEMWFHWENAPIVRLANDTEVTVLSSSGIEVFRLRGEGNPISMQASYWNGSSFVNVGAPGGPLFLGRQRFDLFLTAGVSGSFSFYQNNALLCTGSGFNAAVTNLAGVRFFGGAGGGGRFSQVITGVDDTRDSHLFARQPLAGGFYNTDGAGTVSDVNSVQPDDATAIVLPATGQRRSFTKSAIALPPGLIIAAVGVSGRARISGGVVTSSDAFLRIGGVNYALASTFEGSYTTFNSGRWLVNPATTALFTEAEFNGAEFGLVTA